ncbi:holo-ACP synthase [Candidatus Poriferisodalis sp.]|uniref:holo-ACP synthase n=1 Tax=Candidatus Poriferisodalis sp. TaxID=3101277 RepID=UPI003B018F54
MTASVGLDIVDVRRFARVLERRSAMRSRLFTPAELSYALGTADPDTRLAARFAAKEAVMKVLGVGLGACRFRDIEVARQPNGRPELVLRGLAAQRATAAGLSAWQVTLTHTDGVAAAMVLAQ